jgi:cytoskeleton protein RodZ
MKQEEKSSDVGLYLRNCRRAKGISIEEVANKTKIRVVMLRQVESGDLKKIPPVYVRGFIRAFAGAVGADAEEALRRYNSSYAITSRIEETQATPPKSTALFWPRLLAALLVLIGLIAATVIIANRMQHSEQPASDNAPADLPRSENSRDETHTADVGTTGHANPAGAPSDASLEAVIEAPAQTESEAQTTQDGQDADGGETVAVADVQQPVQKLVLQLSAVERTWMKITSDDGIPREYTLSPDEQITLEAQRRFDLLIGNAGGIRLKLNDGPARIAGPSGKVVRLRLP